MKHLQHVRGKWVVRVTVPQELRDLIGKRELVDTDLPPDAKARERKAVAVVNRFYAMIDEAALVLDSQTEANKPTLSTAAKEHFRYELAEDDAARAITAPDTAMSRSVYANKLRLAVAGKLVPAEAEALVGYAADRLAAAGRAPDLPRPDLLRSLAEVQLAALEAFE